MENLKLSPTERCLLDVFNELRFTKAEKYRLLESYVPVINLYAIPYMIDRIDFIEILKRYAEKRCRSATVGSYYKGMEIVLEEDLE